MSTSAFFIGGWNAKPEHVSAWVRSARLKRPDVAFTGFPWPEGVTSSPAKKVVKGWDDKKQYQPVIDAIKACKADKIYIVGHSSGCAVANAVDKDLNDFKRIVLVVLDGFLPEEGQRPWKDTKVCSARSKGGVALHFSDLHKAVKGDLQVYEARADCTTHIALHFAVVNEAATNKRVPGIPQGYTDCEANLMWLKT